MDKEHTNAYEAGYRDGSVHYELEHCPACKNVADLQEALEENAKLRELVDLYEFGATHDQPPAESLAWNSKVAKLRGELGMEI